MRFQGGGLTFVVAGAVTLATAACGGGSSGGGRWGVTGSGASAPNGGAGTGGGAFRDGGSAGRDGSAGVVGTGGIGETGGGGVVGVSGGAGAGTAGSGAAGRGGAGAGTAGSGVAGSGGPGTGTAGSGAAGSGTAGSAAVDAAADRTPPPDAGAADAGPVCDPIRQTGCLTGAKCGVPPGCFTNGTVTNGMTCAAAGFDDCAAPNLCTGDGVGHVCRQLCGVDADCKLQAAVPAGATPEPKNVPHCLITLTNSTFSVCTFACNPVPKAGASGCPAGYACGYFQTTAVPELTDCEPTGTVVEGGDCTSAGCAGGLVCVNNGTTNHCRQLCRAATNTDCDVAGDSCIAPSGVTSPMFGFCCAATGC